MAEYSKKKAIASPKAKKAEGDRASKKLNHRSHVDQAERVAVPDTDPTPSKTLALTLGEFAYRTLQEQYQHLVSHEKAVLADKDPEDLHQMRVGSRRLYTALQVFQSVITLPKAAHIKRIHRLTQVLGTLRDLDVQLQALRKTYLPNLEAPEQEQLSRVIKHLEQQRRKALAGTRDILSQSRYQDLKTAYETWIVSPQLLSQASVPLALILPDLLSPLLARTLNHPGWFIEAETLSPMMLSQLFASSSNSSSSNSSSKQLGENATTTLHDLRKACKHARYQSEFFASFYGEEFKAWIKNIKALQDTLGGLQDLEILHQQLHRSHVAIATMPQLQRILQTHQATLLATWETQRQPYLTREFRYGLYRMLLDPTP